VTGDVYFGRNVTLRGTVIVVANEGQRIDIPDGCVLENRLLAGNLTMTVGISILLSYSFPLNWALPPAGPIIPMSADFGPEVTSNQRGRSPSMNDIEILEFSPSNLFSPCTRIHLSFSLSFMSSWKYHEFSTHLFFLCCMELL
jgi:hypothetical protein